MSAMTMAFVCMTSATVTQATFLKKNMDHAKKTLALQRGAVSSQMNRDCRSYQTCLLFRLPNLPLCWIVHRCSFV